MFGSSETVKYGHMSFRKLFERLLAFSFAKNADGGNIVNEPQFKVLMSDYNRYIDKQAIAVGSYKKLDHEFYEGFLRTFEAIMGLNRG